MRNRFLFALFLLVLIPTVKSQEQFYSTVDVAANILEIAYDRKLPSTFNGGTTLVVGVRSNNPAGGTTWHPSLGYDEFVWLKMNKTVNCSGQDVSDFVLLPVNIVAMTPSVASSYPATPWMAAYDPYEGYNGIKDFFKNAYLNNLQVKFTRVICGSPQVHPIKNQLVPVAYIQGQKYFTIIPKQADNTANNSAWVNGVQVTPTNSPPTNAVVTNWNFTVPTIGNYDVYVHWVSNKNQVSNISYAVDGQALKSAALDQNINAGIWTKLIKNTQYSAGEHSIKISVDANANYVVDGVRVEKAAQ